MRITTLGLVFALAAFGRAAEAADQTQGKAVYDKWCAGCHDAGPGHAGTLILQKRYNGQLPAPLPERTDLAPDYVKALVRQGKSFMPKTRKTEISDQELEELAAYLSKVRR